MDIQLYLLGGWGDVTVRGQGQYRNARLTEIEAEICRRRRAFGCEVEAVPIKVIEAAADEPIRKNKKRSREELDSFLLTPRDVASKLGISTDLVRTHILQGRLEAVDVSAGTRTGSTRRRACYRIKSESVAQFLEDSSGGGAAPAKPKRRKRKPKDTDIIEFIK